jgi:hypothetical protein
MSVQSMLTYTACPPLSSALSASPVDLVTKVAGMVMLLHAAGGGQAQPCATNHVSCRLGQKGGANSNVATRSRRAGAAMCATKHLI